MTHSSAFRRAVAAEAYTRTPKGGYPEVAARHGLAPADVFAWVDEFYPPGPGPLDVIHVWIGTFAGTQDEFWAYFDEDDHDETDETVCGFCADLGTRYHPDLDLFFGELLAAPRGLGALIEHGVFRTGGAEEAAHDVAVRLGIVGGNAIVCHSDPHLHVPDRDGFNGLVYLGAFADAR